MEIAGIILTFAPVFLVLLVANAAEDRRAAGQPYAALASIAFVLMIVLYGLAFLGGLLIQLGGSLLAQQPQLGQELGLLSLDAGQIDSIALVGVGVWLPALAGMLLLLPPVRRVLARYIPIDSASPVDAVALSLTMLIVINLLVTLGIGLGNVSEIMAGEGELAGASVGVLWTQDILIAALSMVGVGWLTRRSWHDALARLGLVRPTGQQVLLGVAFGLAMVPAIMLIEFVATWLGVGADPDVEALTEQLIGPLFRSPLGIITLGAAAALGEETLFRGALQPRFGLVLTALLFALLHSNYGITISTFVVLLLGLLLGWLRLRHNTTTAMIMHAVYNMTLGLLAYLSISLLEP